MRSGQRNRVPYSSRTVRRGQSSNVPVKTAIDKGQDVTSFWFYFLTLLLLALILTGFAVIIEYFLWDNIPHNGRLNDLLNRRDTIISSLELYERLSNKAMANGYAPLGPDGVIPDEFLPPQDIEPTQFFGCWDASTNTPPLVSGVGEQFFIYTVCAAGSTLLDGISDWLPVDLVYFIGGSFGWFQFQGRVNSIENTAPLSAGEVSLIEDPTGPVMSTNIFSSSDSDLIVTQGGDNIDIEYNPPVFQDVLLQDGGDPTPSGVSFIEDANGPDVSVRSIRFDDGSGVVTDNGDTLDINITGSSLNIASTLASLDMEIVFSVSPPLPLSILCAFQILGNDIARISTLEEIIIPSWDPSETAILAIDTTSSPDPLINANLPSGASPITGLVTGLRGESVVPPDLVVGALRSVPGSLILMPLKRSISSGTVEFQIAVDIVYQVV